MIVRDESAMLAQAIESVRSVVSEIIVVDTGSIAGTPMLAAKLGARVLHAKWTGDFAAARNIALTAATQDWILVLDADEAIDRSQLRLFDVLVRDTSRCFRFTQRHYLNDHRVSGFMPVTNEFPAWELTYLGFFESSLVRFFPNRHGITYVGKLHELVEPSIATLPKLSTHPSSIILHHYGASPEVLERKRKHDTYRTLGEIKTKDNPNDWKAFFELGVECIRPDRLEDSVRAFRRSLELNGKFIPTWSNLGYVLIELGRYQEAIEVLNNGLAVQKNAPEIHCNLGVAFLREKRLKRAELHLCFAVKLSPNYVNALLNLAIVFAAMGNIPDATTCCNRVLELQPKHPLAKDYLSKLTRRPESISA
jgi:tetratricopeptide (TPR) repeat protein